MALKKLNIFIAKAENIVYKSIYVWKKNIKIKQYFAYIILNALSAKDLIS